MNLQKLEKHRKWLFWISLVIGIILCSSIELLPIVIGGILLTAILAFPAFRSRIHLRRLIIFSACATVLFLMVFCETYLMDLADHDVMRLADGLPLWTIMGLILGLILESFFVLFREVIARRGWMAEENSPPFGLAGLACLICLAIIYWVIQLLIAIPNPRLKECLFPALIVIVPLSAPFLILYGSSWRRELPATRRVLSIALRSGVIFGVVLIIAAVLAFGVFVLESFLPVSRGQYGSV
jgi:hypothetical protein